MQKQPQRFIWIYYSIRGLVFQQEIQRGSEPRNIYFGKMKNALQIHCCFIYGPFLR